MKYLLIVPIRIYQATVSQVLPASCRYWPTCSEYGLEALRRHGFFRGSWLTTKRLIRCAPWGGWGHDPVPD